MAKVKAGGLAQQSEPKMPLPPEQVHAYYQANQYIPWIHGHVKLALHCTDLLTEPSKPIKT